MDGQNYKRIFISQLKLKYMITINDLMELDGMYYVGNLVDMDGSGWVSKEVALDLIYNLNIDWVS